MTAAPEHMAPARASNLSDAPLILIVEDDATSRAMLVGILSRDYRTATASNGKEGIAMSLSLRPNLIISDVGMPLMGGSEMVELLRTLPDVHATPIILVTATDDEEIRFGPLRRKVQDFVNKPYETKEMLARTARVLSDQKRSETAIGQAYRLLRAVIDGISDNVYVKDLEGRYLMINKAGAKLLGSSLEELLTDDASLFGSTQTAQKIKDEEALIIANGVATNTEQRIRSVNGVRTYLISRTPYRDDSGQQIGLIGIWRDVTELKTAGNEHFRQIVETANDAFVGIDDAGTITEWNRQAENLFGWARQEAIGLPLLETLIPPHSREAHRGGLGYFFASGISSSLQERREMPLLHRDGHEIPVEMTMWPVTVDGTRHLNAFVRDNREHLRQLALGKKNQELEEENRRVGEASRLKGQFVANMSHELRTPLNAIIGFAEILHDGKVGPTSVPQKDFLGDILTSSRHLLTLINAVLDSAKLESGKMEFNFARLCLTDLVNEVCTVIRPLAAAKRIAVAICVDPAMREVVADSTRLKQVLFNYLSNAVKFTGEGGQVTVRVAPEGPDRFRLSVDDNGIGIETEQQSRLFVEFQQLDAGPAKQFPGTGLGLALTKRIVEAQGGVVGVSSIRGVGSTFFAILPTRMEDNPIAPAI